MGLQMMIEAMTLAMLIVCAFALMVAVVGGK